MVSYFDHDTGTVPRPTILLDKQTDDAHDNPVIAVDDGGLHLDLLHLARPRAALVHPPQLRALRRSTLRAGITPTRQAGRATVPITNFSYMQAWHVPGQGFVCFFTRYGDPAQRTILFMTSRDGVSWSAGSVWRRSSRGTTRSVPSDGTQRARAFNYHPQGKGLNWRTTSYYLETPDFGHTWQTVDGQPLELPLTEVRQRRRWCTITRRGAERLPEGHPLRRRRPARASCT